MQQHRSAWHGAQRGCGGVLGRVHVCTTGLARPKRGAVQAALPDREPEQVARLPAVEG